MSASDWQGQARPTGRAETAEDLRERIAQAERIVGSLRGAGERAATLLYLLDEIHELMAALDGTGLDLRAEAVRVETLAGLLQAKDALLVAEVRRLGGLRAARAALEPESARWWWYLDERVAARRARALRRALVIAGGALAALLVLAGAYRLLFPPEPQRAAALAAQAAAEQRLAAGDTAGAAEHYRQAAAAAPDEAQYQLWLGVLEAQQGHAEEAAAAFARAEALVGERAQFLVQRGMVWLNVGALDEAQADGEAALAARPDSAEAYLLLGGVYEARGERMAAASAFERAGSLAEQAGNSALTVVARMRLGMLLQSAPAWPGETPSPTSAE